MSTAQLQHSAVCASLFRYWNTATLATAITLYPGMIVDVTKRTEWFEVWVQTWSGSPQRSHSPEEATVLITVHVFCRPRTHPGRAQQLVDAARSSLRHLRLTLRDYESSEEPELGMLCLQEPDIQDLSRAEAATERLLHLVVSCRGTAQMCE